MWNIDANPEDADWTKRIWDLDRLRRIAERLRRQQEHSAQRVEGD